MEEKARTLVQQYIDGWKEGSIEKIIALLHEDCVIIESHGPRYRGVDQVRKWFEYWVREKGKVLRWNITSFYFVENTAFFEWDFACNVSGKDHELLGISIVKFSENKISFLHEYRMTKTPYEFN